MNPDTTMMAAGIVFEHRGLVNPVTLTQRVDRAFEIHTYDLAHRSGPRRIQRRVLDRTEQPWIVGWDQSGLLAAVGHAKAVVRIDPVTGAARPIHSVPASSLEEWSKSLNSHDRYRTHVEHRNEGYFLWSPRTRRLEFLFPTPVEAGGKPDAYAADMAGRDRFADTLHRIWEVSARPEAGTTRFSIETYVPRPGEGSRLYLLSLRVEMPDTSGTHFFDDRFVPLAAQELVLGSTGTIRPFAVSNGQLVQSMAPHRRWLRSEIAHGSIPIRIKIQLRPILTAADLARLPYGFLVTSGEDLDVSIPAPKDWTAEALQSFR